MFKSFDWNFSRTNDFSICDDQSAIITYEWITFNTKVEKAARRADGDWDVTLSTGETKTYQWLFVANGHHWDARTPEYPGEFNGYQVHSHHYRDPFEPYDFRGKRVLVVGAGNSAMDISSELSQRPIAERLFISMRRGVQTPSKPAM